VFPGPTPKGDRFTVLVKASRGVHEECIGSVLASPEVTQLPEPLNIKVGLNRSGVHSLNACEATDFLPQRGSHGRLGAIHTYDSQTAPVHHK